MSSPAIEVGQIVEGVVTGITHFGAFVQLPNGKTGLVHISEVADTYVRDVHDYVKEQDRVKVKILSMDPGGKIGLSIRQAQPGASAERRFERGGPRGGPRRGGGGAFEQKLSRFIKESDEKLAELRKKTEGRFGRRGGRS